MKKSLFILVTAPQGALARRSQGLDPIGRLLTAGILYTVQKRNLENKGIKLRCIAKDRSHTPDLDARAQDIEAVGNHLYQALNSDDTGIIFRDFHEAALSVSDTYTQENVQSYFGKELGEGTTILVGDEAFAKIWHTVCLKETKPEHIKAFEFRFDERGNIVGGTAW